jgi:hypothetical protein
VKLLQRLDYWFFDLPAYALGAMAGFAIGTYLLHWSLGLLGAALVVLGLRAISPAIDRLLGRGASK